jgi:lipopolysaccharide export system permease protein
VTLPLRLLRDWTRVVAGSTLGAWIGALLLFQAIDAFENLRDYGQAGADGREVAIFFLLRSPELAVQILPAALLIGALLGVFRLVRHREVTAAEAAGLHPGWLYAVPLGLAALATLIQLGLENGPLPALRARSERYEAEHILRDPLKARRDVRWVLAGDALWRIGVNDGDASSVRWNLERYGRDGTQWTLDRADGVQLTATGDWHADTVTRAVWPPLTLERAAALPAIPFLPAELKPQPVPIDQIPIGELAARASDKRAVAGSAGTLQLDLHQRLSWPWLNLSVLLAVLPLVPRHGRRASTAVGVLLALATGILGWAAVVAGQALASSWHQPLGYWLPHLLLGLTGGALLVRRWWQGRPRPVRKG